MDTKKLESLGWEYCMYAPNEWQWVKFIMDKDFVTHQVAIQGDEVWEKDIKNISQKHTFNQERPPKEVSSYRLPKKTISQIRELSETFGSQANVITLAVDRLFQKEIEDELAETTDT